MMQENRKIDKLFPNLKKHQYLFFLLLTIAVGIIVLLPLFHFHRYISQGDHGRDLYCFKKTMEGAVPYRDYSWVLGPLMPYYYSFIFRLCGATIQSALLGQNILILLTGIIIFLCSATLLSPVMSFLAALCYWVFRGAEFFYTYTHIGGLASMLGVILFFMKYLKAPQKKYAFGGYFCVLILLFVRLNIGVAVLLTYCIFLLLADYANRNPLTHQNRVLYVWITIGIGLTAFLVYFSLIKQIPAYAIFQCFPYSSSFRTDIAPSWSDKILQLFGFLNRKFSNIGTRNLFFVLMAACLVQSILFLKDKQTPRKTKINYTLSLSFLGIMIFAAGHEFLLSGVAYRLYWILPILILIAFFLIDIATKKQNLWLARMILIFVFLFTIASKHSSQNKIDDTYRNPFHLFSIGKNRVYSYQSFPWISTVSATVDFIKEHTSEGEKIFAVPFDPIYYFLSGRDSATRQLIFFEHKNITEEQQRNIIAGIKKHNVNLIVLSNRSIEPNPGMGIFGKTYCRTLNDYIVKHYEVAAAFGDWVNPGGWAWNHGTKILMRKK